MRLALSSDHAGYELKRDLAAILGQKGHAVLDLGTHSTAPCDYPDAAESVAQALRNGEADRGIIIPVDFSAHLVAREKTGIEFYENKDADKMASILVQIRVFRALAAMTGLLVEHVIENENAPLTEEAMRRLLDTPDPVTVDAKFAGRRPQLHRPT